MKGFKQKDNLDHFYEKIEHEVQDDMAMFLEFGEDYFSLEELERLYYQWEHEFKMTDKWRGRFVILCTGSFMLLPLAGFFMMLGMKQVLPIVLYSFPVFFILGVAGFLTLYFRYGRLAYQESVGRRLKFAIRNKRKRRGFPKDFKRDS